MKIIALLIPTLCVAQAITLTPSGPANYQANAPFTLSVNATASTSAAQGFTVTLPAGVTATAVAAGSAATAAAKGIACAPATLPATGSLTCLVFGQNKNAIGAGPVASITVNPTGSAALSFSVSNPSAADASAASVAATAGPALVIPWALGKCDLNADGKVDSSDVNAMVSTQTTILAAGATTTNVLQAVIAIEQVILAATGGGCGL